MRFLASLFLLALLASPLRAGEAIPSGPINGIASYYPGTVAATPWCVYPWRDCGDVDVTSHRTGITIRVHVAMFCQCLVGTPTERLIDLIPAEVIAVGEPLSAGLYEITLTPLSAAPDQGVPNTAVGGY